MVLLARLLDTELRYSADAMRSVVTVSLITHEP